MKWSKRIAEFLAEEDGPTAVEYAVMLALIAGMIIASLVYLGDEARQMSEVVVDGLDGALNE